MLNVERLLEEKAPPLYTKHEIFRKSFLFIFKRLFRERELNQFILENQNAYGFDFVDQILDFYNFSYSVNHKQLENIPATGRAVIVANHPLGALDGIALLDLVRRVRPDVKIVANELLGYLKPLQDLFLPVDNLGYQSTRAQVKAVQNWLNDDHVVIIFPAGEVSRAGFFGIQDTSWKKSFVTFAEKSLAPIIPIHVDGKNSLLFYIASMLYKPLSTFLLVREMFKQYSHSLDITVGEQISSQHLADSNLTTTSKARLVRKHLYRIGHNKRPLLKTVRAVAHPQDRQELMQAINECEKLGETNDGKKILLFQYKSEQSVILKELGRLREYTFRFVGEGTGKRFDNDEFDYHYDHLILWDDKDLEVVGAYRFGNTKTILDTKGPEGLYTSSLYSFSPQMNVILEKGLELGRSFVQPKYWGRRSLDYLWFGIGAYLRKNPDIRYLFGTVSISASYNTFAREMMTYFYQLHFPYKERVAVSSSPFTINTDNLENFKSLFKGESYSQDFKVLKEQLSHLGYSVPTLYKQYSELTTQGGVEFLEFSIDQDFNNCLDGLVLVDIDQLKPNKRSRYIAS
ncbi:MAG: GNAT family N-acyltransferase [Pseudomonadota bacterium]